MMSCQWIVSREASRKTENALWGLGWCNREGMLLSTVKISRLRPPLSTGFTIRFMAGGECVVAGSSRLGVALNIYNIFKGYWIDFGFRPITIIHSISTRRHISGGEKKKRNICPGNIYYLIAATRLNLSPSNFLCGRYVCFCRSRNRWPTPSLPLRSPTFQLPYWDHSVRRKFLIDYYGNLLTSTQHGKDGAIFTLDSFFRDLQSAKFVRVYVKKLL